MSNLIIFDKVTINDVITIVLEDVNPVTNMDINKDADDAVSQHNWILEFILLIPLVLSLTFDAFQVVLLLSGDTVLSATTDVFNFTFWCTLCPSFVI